MLHTLFQKENMLTICISIAFIYYYMCFYNWIYSNTFEIDTSEEIDTNEFRKNINNPNHPSYTKCISNICTNGQFIGAQIRMLTN